MRNEFAQTFLSLTKTAKYRKYLTDFWTECQIIFLYNDSVKFEVVQPWLSR